MTVPPAPVLTDPTLYESGDPYPAWARLRRDAPISWQDGDPGHEPFWAVARYADGLEVLTDWERFSSGRGTLLRPNLSDPFPGQGTMMTLTDPPRHTALRKIVRRLFTPRAVSDLTTRARDVSGRLVGRMLDGPCDFAADVAGELPMAVVGELLGVRPEDARELAGLTAQASDNIGDMGGETARSAHLEVLAYYAGVIEERRASPGEDIVSALVRAQRQGDGITDDEIMLTCDNIVVAAGETTRHASSTGLLALVRAPREMTRVWAGDVDLDRVVEEVLRWGAPVNHIMRTARHDTTLRGVPIGAGEVVSAWIGSMNRDEAVFADGHRFVADRHPNRHATFGGGAHYCLGHALARLMLRSLLTELVGAVGHIELDGPPVHMASHIVNGLRALPLRARSR